MPIATQEIWFENPHVGQRSRTSLRQATAGRLFVLDMPAQG